jgi:hypothetical protein
MNEFSALRSYFIDDNVVDTANEALWFSAE